MPASALLALLGCARGGAPVSEPHLLAAGPDAASASPDDSAQAVVARCGFHQDFALSRKLGEGSYGSVYLASRADDGETFAVKVTDLRRSPATERKRPCNAHRHRQATTREISCLRLAAGSPYIVRFVDLFVEGGLAYVVLEKCDLSLLQHLEALPELNEEALKPALRHMLCGLAAIHSIGIAHRDVKPDNFLFHRGVVKLCDFGLACRAINANRFELVGVVGTPAFMAPEMLRGEPYGVHVDVWSFGVIAYILCFGRYPYEPATPTGPSMIAAIREGSPAPCFRPKDLRPRGASDRAVRFLRPLLCRRPGWRPTADESRRHAFFADGAGRADGNQISLRPMLADAKRIGAFSPIIGHQGSAGPSRIDVHLADLQELSKKQVASEGDGRSSASTRAESSSCLSSVSG
mmetsp:Transcript_123541/g.357222  ORF Transcript_123541/g.357222 Transcript_123541/m.357222 type:complete len:407 (-) Transcript_123541:402-1622(-)